MEGMPLPHPCLPQIPFYVGVIGPRHTGKSVFLYSVLKKAPGTYGNTFKKENIILFSPTKDKDPTLHELNLKWTYGPPTSPQALVDSVIQQQKSHGDSDNQTGVLLVWDDITQIRDAWRPLEDLSYYGRHDHIHVLYVAHKMSSIPRGVRTQTQQWIIFKPHEESERQWIMDMFARKRTRDIWEMALLRCWNIEYNFAYIDFEQKELERIYRSGLEECLFTPEEQAIISGENMDVLFGNKPFYNPDGSDGATDEEKGKKKKRDKENKMDPKSRKKKKLSAPQT